MDKSQVKTTPGLTTKCTTTLRVLLVLLLQIRSMLEARNRRRYARPALAHPSSCCFQGGRSHLDSSQKKDGILLLRSGTTQVHGENSKASTHCGAPPTWRDPKTLQFRCWVILVPCASSADLIQVDVQPSPTGLRSPFTAHRKFSVPPEGLQGLRIWDSKALTS